MIRDRALSPDASSNDALAEPPVGKFPRATPGLLRNVTANFIGTVWTAIMGPALVAVYIRFLGIEAYGLVGILATLQAVFTLLDLGLSTTLNRELARLSVYDDSVEAARNLVRTVEALYWSVAALIALVVALLSPLLASHWIHAEHLSAGTIREAFLMMGWILAFQFPFALYSGGLVGLQRQVLLNGIAIAIATARGIGSVLLLWLVAPTIQVFFIWQLLVTVAQTGLTALFLWRSLPFAVARPRFRLSLLQATWRFAAGLMGIAAFALLFMQGDKILLSRLLPLDEFGYYSLAAVVASGLYIVVLPVYTAVFPRFSQLVAANDEVGLRALYHRSCQIVSVALLPTAVVVALFAPEILQVWTRNSTVVQHAHLLVSLLVTGSALNGLLNLPYALQLAFGWTRLAFFQNAIAAAFLIPLLVWAANRYGGPGAAAIWITVNAGCVVIGIQIMHTRLLRGEQRYWYVRDVGLPMASALIVGVIGRWLFPAHASTPVMLAGLALVFSLMLLGTAIVTPFTHEFLMKRILPPRVPEGMHAD